MSARALAPTSYFEIDYPVSLILTPPAVPTSPSLPFSFPLIFPIPLPVPFPLSSLLICPSLNPLPFRPLPPPFLLLSLFPLPPYFFLLLSLISLLIFTLYFWKGWGWV